MAPSSNHSFHLTHAQTKCPCADQTFRAISFPEPTYLLVSNILTSLMESWCIIFMGNQLFFGQNQPKDGFRILRFPVFFGAKRDFIYKHSVYILLIYKERTEYISKRGSQHAGRDLFLNSEVLKNFHACLSINKHTLAACVIT